MGEKIISLLVSFLLSLLPSSPQALPKDNVLSSQIDSSNFSQGIPTPTIKIFPTSTPIVNTNTTSNTSPDVILVTPTKAIMPTATSTVTVLRTPTSTPPENSSYTFKPSPTIRPLEQSLTETTATALIKRKEAIVRSEIKRRAFERSLLKVADTKKRVIAKQIDSKISTFNQNHTDKMAGALDSLQQILDKISSQSTQLKTRGINTATLDVSIADAQKAINHAKTQVLNQAGRDYVASVSGEMRLKMEVGTAVSQFRLDLQTANKSVIAAKQAVHNAASELAKLTSTLKNRQNLDTSTTSGLKP